MLLVPVPDVIVDPWLSVHTYVAPPVAATEAVLPAEPVHTDPAVVIVAPGKAIIGIDLFAEVLLQPLLLVTVTVSVTNPDLVAE
jgi:hypothetical protein